jgi:6-phosphogluconolactonase
VANYGSGSVVVLPTMPDGKLDNASTFIQFNGSSVNKDRQKSPHAHGFALDRSGKHAYACDLGTDKVMIFTLDSESGGLDTNNPPYFSLAPGSGPRHIAFHPSGRWAYIINELTSTVTVAKYDQQTGGLKELQTLTTLPKDFSGINTCAEIVVHPSGRFLYCSNRGDDTIAAYEIDVKTGKLTFLQHQSTLGNTPRGFGIDPTGKYLIVGNMDSGTVAVLRINLHSGKLQTTGQVLECPSTVCVQFLPWPLAKAH